MIVERTDAKKSLAVTLILALALSLPGTGAWAQIYNARAASGASASAAAPSAAAVGGLRIGVAPVPSLAVGVLGLAPALLSPALIAPAAAPLAPVIVPIAAAPAVAPVTARAVAAPGVARPAPRGSLEALFRAAEMSDVEAQTGGQLFDGAEAQSSDIHSFSSLEAGVSKEDGFRSPPSFTPPPALAAATPNQQRMVRTLHQVASVFAEQYAPLDLKKELFAHDLEREYDRIKAAILSDPNMTTRQFQNLLFELVSSMRDYHVSISFNSTESSKLPFQVGGAEGRYYLTFVDREKLPSEVFPFKMGDEVVSFNGVPTAEAVKALAARAAGNTPETDLRMAELFLTNRRRARGDTDIPQGAAEIVIRSKGEFYKVMMPWDYTPELVAPDVPSRNAGLLEPEGFGGSAPASGPASAGFFSSVSRAFTAAVHPLVDIFTALRVESADNPFMIGARKSFVPRLGEIVWESPEDGHFHAYIFKTKEGRKMGYLRIAAYDGDYAEVKEYAKIIEKFQAETEGLVIDQVSNPGGSLFYLYALASHLTDKTLVTPRHRLIIGENDAQQSAEFLLQMKRESEKSPEAREREQKKATKEKEEPNAGGYPITGKFMALMVRSAQYILKQFTSGKRFTGLVHISGVDDIDPAPKPEQRYTKPILLLTNALDFSGGDFFPAIMQDNGRATVMGVRTAGAGGIVKPFSINQFGVSRLSATTSLAQRPSGLPIENLGVTPDIPYEITAKDLRTGFAEYRWNILKALRGLLEPAKAP